MNTIQVSINSIEKIQSFVWVVSRHEGRFYLESEHHVVNATSIIGIFSLDLSRPLTLKMDTPENLTEVMEDLEAYKI